jgi:hypothetical protein
MVCCIIAIFFEISPGGAQRLPPELLVFISSRDLVNSPYVLQQQVQGVLRGETTSSVKGASSNKVEHRESRPLGEEVGEPEVDVVTVIERQTSSSNNNIITTALANQH